MGVKLYPPVLEDMVPACWKDSNGMVNITIPFTMNRSVSAAQVTGFKLKIKTVQTGTQIGLLSTENEGSYSIVNVNGNTTFSFIDYDNILKTGQFYKVQLAYTSSDGEGYYSNISTMKCTSKPKLFINNFNHKLLNAYTHKYTGYYDQTEGDLTEKVYSYRFDIFDKKNNIIYTSNECIHNGQSDDETSVGLSFDIFELSTDVQYDTVYYIQYTVTTINNLTISSPKYRIVQQETIAPEIHATLKAQPNFDNGYVDLILVPNNKNVLDSGSFVISRASEDNNFLDWEKLHVFQLYRRNPKGLIFRDYTFEQGKTYLYSLQQFNDYDLYSKRLLSDKIFGDFEDGFLYDGQRQLKIRYNMKMSKITRTILESKQETIGNKYPFFFRNGVVNYHEFPINGLISYSMDEARLFLGEEYLNLNTKTSRTETFSATTNFKDSLGEEITRERIFKNEVLNWLNNGQPKLLRTPTEGNFIVRLMKVSLSPEDKLGRMLHNFSCTAYEVADFSSENLKKYNLLKMTTSETLIPQWKSIDLSGTNSMDKNCDPANVKLNVPAGSSITSLHFDSMWPGETFTIVFRDEEDKTIQIGSTGDYHLDNVNLNIASIKFYPRFKKITEVITENDFSEKDINYYILDNNGKYKVAKTYDEFETYYINTNPLLKGIITYGYTVKQGNDFSKIQSVSYDDSVIRQFIGETNILNSINNAKTELSKITYLKVTKRPINNLVSAYFSSSNDNGEYYYGVAVNEDGDNYSEHLPKIELTYPIGLRVYKPDTYYIKNSSGSFVKDSRANWNPETTYYLKGDYENTTSPVGLSYFQTNTYFTREIVDGKEVYDLAATWQHKVDYYDQRTTAKGQVYYVKMDYMTDKADYVFKPDTFYKIAHEKNGTHYTLAQKFQPEFYNNWIKPTSSNLSPVKNTYYYLDETHHRNNYVNAYVTKDFNHVYQGYNFYIHLTNSKKNKDEYHLCTALEFNVNEYDMQSNDVMEYENYDKNLNSSGRDNTVLKYYKIKTTLPHNLYTVSNGWLLDSNERSGYGGYNNELVSADPINFYQLDTVIKYKDLYNNKNYTTYNPTITINNQVISVEDSIVFGPKDLSTFGPISVLKCGNGVYVDIVYAVKQYEYIKENQSGTSAASAKKTYLEAIENYNYAMERLSPGHADYIDLNDNTSSAYTQYYNNTYQEAIWSAYKTLVGKV